MLRAAHPATPAAVHLISSGGVYGAESMLLGLLKALKDTAWHPVLGVFVNSNRPNTEIAERALGEQIEVHLIPCAGRADWQAVRRVSRLLERPGGAVLHTHGYKADLYGFPAARLARVPLMATCHNWTNEDRSLRMYARLDRWVLRRFQAVSAVSPAVADALRTAGVAPARITVIGNGIEVERFSSASAAPDLQSAGAGSVIGMVGRLVPQKGFLDVLACAPEILARYPGTRFLIAGDGPQRGELEEATRKAGLEAAVVLMAARRDVERLYAAMDVFVLPSMNEGMPMTVLEAMAAGKPVVGTRVGVIAEMLGDGAGLVVEPGDRRGLADALLSLLADRERGARMGETGRERARSLYSSAAMAQRYVNLYDQLSGSRHAA